MEMLSRSSWIHSYCLMVLNQVLILLICFSALQAQNLVPNPNFEAFSNCPAEVNSFTVRSWTSPFWPGSPNYFNVCGGAEVDIPVNFAGQQDAASGDAYVGLYTYGFGTREYIQAKLTEPTLAGAVYELTIVFSSAEDFGHADGLGMLLTEGAPTTERGQLPQLEKVSVVESQNDWHTLTIAYTSPGGETHVTIGNFKNDINTEYVPEGRFRSSAYYYIDSVAVTCKGVASDNVVVDLGGDVEACPADFPLTLSSSLPDAYNEWSTGEEGAAITVFVPGIYAVKSTVDCEYGTDTIRVTRINQPGELFAEDLICTENPYLLEVDDTLGEYIWNDGTIGPILEVDQTGEYTLALRHECGIFTDTIEFIFREDIAGVELLDVYTLCNDEPLRIDLRAAAASEIQWSDGENVFVRDLQATGEYEVTLANTCFDSTYAFEFKQELCVDDLIHLPNAFSPNEDGVNDFFFAQFSEQWAFPRIKFDVFDRWGNQVYSTQDPAFRWDGTFDSQPLDAGVFVYVYTLEVSVNGRTELVSNSGEIALIK